MTRRTIWTLIFAALGLAFLLGLGTWQVQRHFWKQGILTEMEARLTDAPVALPAEPDPQTHRYLAVELSGSFTDEELRVMASQREAGPGYRLIAAFETDQSRRILVDRGFIPAEAANEPRPSVEASITGNLHWPEEADLFTPDPDDGLWFAREVAPMARALDTEPVLVVLRSTSEAAPPARPLPLDTSAIPDNHRNYAITWYLLALAWAVMTGAFLWRIRQRNRDVAGAG